uniref:DUF4200 domain-containing protein n=1 Tax=Parastrongyloides trichosuri TaxID=131310 RepID=A0A0N4Z9C5_PARTI
MVYNEYTEVEKPLNVMSDPRIFRGSVIAKQREYLKQKNEYESKRLKEMKYQTNVLRSRLDISFRKKNMEETNCIDSFRIINNSKSRDRQRNSQNLPKVNGILGVTRKFFDIENKIMMNEDVPRIPIYNNEINSNYEKNNDKKKLLPLRKEIQSRSFSSEDKNMKLINGYNGYRKESNIKNVKFVPLYKKIQLGNKVDNNYPTIVIPTFSSFNESTYDVRKSRKKMALSFNKFTVPHNSLESPVSYTNSEVQTSDEDEVYLQSIAKELSINAIFTAIKNIKVENQIEKLIYDKNVMEESLVNEHDKIEDLKKEIDEKNSNEERLIRERKEMEKLIKILESKKLAFFTVNDVINNSINTLLDNDIIKETPKYKSIANDTMDLEKMKKRYKIAFNEIKFDFMPWIIRRAEKVVIQKRAEKELREALFSKHKSVRQNAQKMLKQFINDSEKLHYKPYKF